MAIAAVMTTVITAVTGTGIMTATIAERIAAIRNVAAAGDPIMTAAVTMTVSVPLRFP